MSRHLNSSPSCERAIKPSPAPRQSWTVQCGFAAYYANTVVVEANSPEEACERAIDEANSSDAWKSLDHCGETFIDAIAPGADVSPWHDHNAAKAVPDRYAENGEERSRAAAALAFVKRVAADLGAGTPDPVDPTALAKEAVALLERFGLASRPAEG